MKRKHIGHELTVVLPVVLNAVLGIATLALSCKMLRKLHHVNRGLKEIREGRREIREGRDEILGRKKK